MVFYRARRGVGHAGRRCVPDCRCRSNHEVQRRSRAHAPEPTAVCGIADLERNRRKTNMPGNPFPLSKDQLLQAYRSMPMIREFEERLHVEFAKGDIPGFVHLYAGEEACAAGIILQLTDIDRLASTHRGHGHCIAKGVDVHSMMAEIYGKETGSCRGKGGSMHIADLSKGMMGANGILGAGAPLIC